MSDEIVIIDSDPKKILLDIEELYKKTTLEVLGEERTLEKSEPRWLDYKVLTYLVSTIKAEMNDAAKQNYLRYARGKRIDLKGEFYGSRGLRQTAEKAKTTMQCYIQEVKTRDVIIKAGTRFIKDEYLFKSIEEHKIPIGKLFTDVQIEATKAGYVPIYEKGEVTEIVDLYDFYDKCENVTEVVGGVDILEDEIYKEKLKKIPETYSTAGPSGSYEFYTQQTSTLIKDVYIDNPTPNNIDVYIIGENGAFISEEIKNSVLDSLSRTDIRPMGDIISIKDPEKVDYIIDFIFYIDKKNETKALEIEQNIISGIEKYKIDMNKMGQDINYQDIITIAIASGAKKIKLNSPSTYIDIRNTQIPVCIKTNIVDGGIE